MDFKRFVEELIKNNMSIMDINTIKGEVVFKVGDSTAIVNKSNVVVKGKTLYSAGYDFNEVLQILLGLKREHEREERAVYFKTLLEFAPHKSVIEVLGGDGFEKTIFSSPKTSDSEQEKYLDYFWGLVKAAELAVMDREQGYIEEDEVLGEVLRYFEIGVIDLEEAIKKIFEGSGIKIPPSKELSKIADAVFMRGILPNDVWGNVYLFDNLSSLMSYVYDEDEYSLVDIIAKTVEKNNGVLKREDLFDKDSITYFEESGIYLYYLYTPN